MPWDALIVGARVAGAATAIHLARRGHRVLVLDRATFPSDTLSTHNCSRDATPHFERLGVLDAIEASGTPALTRTRIVAPLHDAAFTGSLRGLAEPGYCVRRVLLDHLLVQTARSAGAEVREDCTVTELIGSEGQVGGVAFQHEGRTYHEQAQVVLGADGRHSRVARWVGAHTYRADPAQTPLYFSYFQNVSGPRDTLEVFRTDARELLLLPTDSSLTCAVVVLPDADLPAFRSDHECAFAAEFAAIPELGERFASAERVGPVLGAVDLASHLRVPIGPGWALVGDAGAHIHPVTARGIGLALRDAHLLAGALAAALEGTRDPGTALMEYHALRDAEADAVYTLALEAAHAVGTPLPEAAVALWRALGQLPAEADAFVTDGFRLPNREAYDRIIQEAAATESA